MITAAGGRGGGAEAGVVARGEDQGSFFLEQLREPVFELGVQVERAVEEATAGGPAAVAMHRAGGGGEDARMVREAQVVVRAYHDLPLVLDPRFSGGRL